ncbi:FAD dependent oxidoreductase, partial [Usnea florida]
NPHAASIDSSRIIRPDYALPAYANLAAEAQGRWRAGFGGGAYRESGLVLGQMLFGTSTLGLENANADRLDVLTTQGYEVERLGSPESVRRVVGTGGDGGERGYVNWGSGWADAGKAMEEHMRLLMEKVRDRNGNGKDRIGQVVFKRGKARNLIFKDEGGDGKDGQRKRTRRVIGATLDDNGDDVLADLTIVAGGAWSGALVDLRGRAEARGQVLAYIGITEEERWKLRDMPVVLNLSTGMFAIPPTELSTPIARHAFGYANPTVVAPEGEDIVVSLPALKFSDIPLEGEHACRSFLKRTIPWLGDRPFRTTRICWYMDTTSGNFLIDYHPKYEGLFLATGGSGHGFKFLPVLGKKIVAAVEGRLEGELADLWRWPEKQVLPFRGCEDGSRTGNRGILLGDEWARNGEREAGGLRSML